MPLVLGGAHQPVPLKQRELLGHGREEVGGKTKKKKMEIYAATSLRDPRIDFSSPRSIFRACRSRTTFERLICSPHRRERNASRRFAHPRCAFLCTGMHDRLRIIEMIAMPRASQVSQGLPIGRPARCNRAGRIEVYDLDATCSLSTNGRLLSAKCISLRHIIEVGKNVSSRII